MIPFNQLLIKRRGDNFEAPKRLLCLDPGETTGWAIYEDAKLSAAGHAMTKAEGWECIDRLFTDTQPMVVLYENYRVYQHKLERHSNSEVYTLRLVGVIEYLCDVKWQIPYFNQMAYEHKGFVTDEKLKDWGMYKTGYKHARDAIRMGAYFLLFNKALDNK